MLPAIGSICCGNSWVKTAIAVFTTTNDNGKVEELRKIPPPENRKIHSKIDSNLYIAFYLLGSRVEGRGSRVEGRGSRVEGRDGCGKACH